MTLSSKVRFFFICEVHFFILWGSLFVGLSCCYVCVTITRKKETNARETEELKSRINDIKFKGSFFIYFEVRFFWLLSCCCALFMCLFILLFVFLVYVCVCFLCMCACVCVYFTHNSLYYLLCFSYPTRSITQRSISLSPVLCVTQNS